MDKLEAIRRRAEAETFRTIRKALVAEGWRQRPAAARLGCPLGTMRKAIARNKPLRDEAKRRAKLGRPKLS